MIAVQIGDEKRDIAVASTSWINEQINRRRRANDPVCVQVIFHRGDLRIRLATPDCPTNGGRQASPQEQEIFDLWYRQRLDQPDFTADNLVAFLRQLS